VIYYNSKENLIKRHLIVYYVIVGSRPLSYFEENPNNFELESAVAKKTTN